MRFYKNIFLTICCINAFLAYSQNIDVRKFDYSKVDSFVLKLPDYKTRSVAKLTKKITKPFSTDYEKARAIFIWITEHISYDCKAYHFPKLRTEDSKKILKQRKAICGGYSSLFASMANTAGIPCQYIGGIASETTRYKEIGKIKGEPHAWNAIKLQGEWYLTDATWGSGYGDEKCTVFVKSRNETYFLTYPEIFGLAHLPDPKQSRWLLYIDKFTKEQFRNLPLSDQHGISVLELTSFYPKEGIIYVEKGKKIKFSFKTANNHELKTIKFFRKELADDKEVKTQIEKGNLNPENGVYSYSFTATESGTRLIEVHLNNFYVFTYKIVVK
jgi:transglutaminase/protease-like cytokinesis protein 3